VELALEARGLTRYFGELAAVDRIDLSVPSGSFYGFLGPNGAGKSTTIRCLTGLLRPSSGQMRILGIDPQAEPIPFRRQVGVVPEELALFERLTGPETLSFVGQVHGLDPKTVRDRTAELLNLMDLEPVTDRLVADYSHGMRKKLALALALLPGPRMLFLDEPFEGIDAVASRQLRNLLLSFVRGGGTIFLTSHILEIVGRLCDQIGVIHRGRIVAEGPLEDLQRGTESGRTLEEIFLDLVGAEEEELPALDWLR